MGHFLFQSNLLFIGYIQNALTVNIHSIFTIVRSSKKEVQSKCFKYIFLLYIHPRMFSLCLLRDKTLTCLKLISFLVIITTIVVICSYRCSRWSVYFYKFGTTFGETQCTFYDKTWSSVARKGGWWGYDECKDLKLYGGNFKQIEDLANLDGKGRRNESFEGPRRAKNLNERQISTSCFQEFLRT